MNFHVINNNLEIGRQLFRDGKPMPDDSRNDAEVYYQSCGWREEKEKDRATRFRLAALARDLKLLGFEIPNEQ